MLLSIIVFQVTTLAAPSDFPIENMNFEQIKNGKPLHWHWWSREGQYGSVAVSDSEKQNRQYSAFIRYKGSKDWALVNRNKLSLEPGAGHRFSAWIKVLKGKVNMTVVNMKNGKKLIAESTRFITPRDGQAWQQVELINETPQGMDQLDIRFRGKGPVQAYIDNIRIQPHTFKEIAQKPAIKGFAVTRIREKLDRGLVAMIREDGSAYIGWRLLEQDPEHIAFNVYRSVADAEPTRLNDTPIVQTTDFIDSTAPTGKALSYQLEMIKAEKTTMNEQTATVPASATARSYLSVEVGDYQFQKAGIADLDGDGRYDYVIKQPHHNIDPWHKYWKKSPGTYKLEAYTADGELLWRYDLGWAIERGIWYSPYLVYDFNGDGKAEIAVKTGKGDPRDPDGRVQSGPEYLTILDGLTGEKIAQTDWLPREPFYEKEKAYNYASRNQLGVAYLDGKTPCIIVGRGTYNIMMARALELQGSELHQLWHWDNLNMRRRFQGQGAHSMHAVDVDDDGRQEVSLGSLVLDDNGTVLWSTGLGHPDHHFVGDINPLQSGLEIYYGIERRQPRNGMCLVDARSGDILWGYDHPSRHVHSSGLCSDIMAQYPGAECYSSDRDENKKPSESRLWSSRGKIIRDDLDWGFGKLALYWDADPQREVIMNRRIQEAGGKTYDLSWQGRIVAIADILGDWREEMITAVKGELRIYSTTLPAKNRHVCLMQDPLYRNDVAIAAMGYYQIPMLSYDLASKMVK